MIYSPLDTAQAGTPPRITLPRLIAELAGLVLFLCSALALSALGPMMLWGML